MKVSLKNGPCSIWSSVGLLVLLFSLAKCVQENPKDKRNITAMDTVVNANHKQDSLTKRTLTDDLLFPKMQSSSGSQDYSAAIKFNRNLWPNGRIHYKMDRQITRRPNHLRMIKAAMAEWERNTCLRFINKTNDPAYQEFVYIYHGIGCRGSVGRWRGQRSLLSLGKWCDNFKVVLHELGHTIGYFHEQNRPDRNKYVEILWNNINPKWKWTFNRKKQRLVKNLGMPYDYNSIMHYGTQTYSINGKPALRARDPTIKYLGNTGLSLIDIKQTNKLYSCIDFPNFPEDFFFTKSGGKRLPHCITMTEPKDTIWNSTNICYGKDKKNINLKWSNSGPVPSMRCTNTAMTNRRNYARFWRDNYLCVPRDSVLRFDWSVSGPINGMKCTGIRVHPRSRYLYHLCAVRTDKRITDNNRGSSYTDWSPWQPCSKDCGGGKQSRFRRCKNGRICLESLVDRRFCNNHRCSSWPHWPSDFQYHIGYIKPIHSCIRVFERNQYSKWLRNWFCWKIMRRRRLKILWSDMNEVPGMRCTQITEPREKKNSGWDNNYLCVQQDALYRFHWSSNGTIKGLHCAKWMGKNGKDGWDNNYLCADEYPEKTGCPDGWIANRTKTTDVCYHFEKKALTWPKAQKACQKYQANLLSLRNREELKFVKDKVQKGKSVWIGANDRKTQGEWRWTDGTHVAFSNWDSGEPNNGGHMKNEHCALLRFDGKWNDYPCEEYPFPSICKKLVPRT